LCSARHGPYRHHPVLVRGGEKRVRFGYGKQRRERDGDDAGAGIARLENASAICVFVATPPSALRRDGLAERDREAFTARGGVSTVDRETDDDSVTDGARAFVFARDASSS
jgi:hypothetical protein